jgi:uncharacterized membrane protein
MSAGSLAAVSPVLVVGAVMCLMPVVTRPTVQFGVRVPRERAGAPVIGRERRAYYWRTAAIGVCCTVVAVLVQGHWPSWLTRIILVPELAAGLGCFWVARRKIAAVKNADGWFAGLRQTVVTDTSWRTDPPRFPVRWLIPALAVIAATAAVGALRYPGLPARIVTGSGHRVPKSAVSVLIVAGQLYFTAVYSGLMLIVHRSRPDIEAADPAASTLRYRRFLAAFTRALLTLAALVDVSLLLIALPDWQVYRLSGIGRALPVLPFAAGVLLLAAVAARAGQGGSRLNGNVRGLASAAGTDRDDDQFWKAGLVYVNRDDPALVVGARFGVGWALNYGNPVAWLLIAGCIAWWAGLAALGAVAGILPGANPITRRSALRLCEDGASRPSARACSTAWLRRRFPGRDRRARHAGARDLARRHAARLTAWQHAPAMVAD